jgi:hypothetical protein
MASRASSWKPSLQVRDPRSEHRAKNESLFRDVNERIEALEQEFGAGDVCEFVCECAWIECSERFEMSLDAYEDLRSDPTTFAVLPGHESLGVEDVVAERTGYVVVRKRAGEPARIAAEDAPR